MSGPRIGELFAGYGGLGMGVKAVLGGDVAWYSDVCKFDKDGNAGHYDPHRGPCRIWAHRHPDVPNIGDIAAVDWSEVEPVDIVTGGFPCQDVSSAGKRAGIRPGTRSGLWTHFAYAIDQLRPQLVVIENVRGLLNAEAHSDVEPCPWCVGDDADGVMRALGAVLGDLADLGFDAEWVGLRAADVGAPHGRFRVFIVAHPQGNPWRVINGDGESATDAGSSGRHWRTQAPQRGPFGGTSATGSGTRLLPSPRTSDTNGPGAHGDGGLDLRTVVSLLPTPMSRDWKGSGPADANRHDPNLSAIPLLLPTPRATDFKSGYTFDGATAHVEAGWGSLGETVVTKLLQTPLNADAGPRGGTTGFGLRDWSREHDTQWGEYAEAIHRWESLTRPVPPPTEMSAKGKPRLSPAFSEWLMGLPDGWITAVPGVARNEALKLAGNGVVPQQAEAALRFLLGVTEAAA